MNKKVQNNLLKLVQKNYDEIADNYSETRKKKMSSNLWGALMDISKDVKVGESILDIGCGNGRLLDLFLEKEIKYLGIDRNNALIEHAKKIHPKNEFLIGDLLDLGKLSQINFDYVFSVAVLHHIPGSDLQIQALKQLRNKIKPNGKIIITIWNLWGQKKYRKLIFRFVLLKLIGKNKMDLGDILFDWKNSQGERISQRYYHGFRKCELKRIVRKAGLKIETINKDKYNYYLVLSKK